MASPWEFSRGAKRRPEYSRRRRLRTCLASLVHHSAVIFAGEVYAIRVPQRMKGTERRQWPGLPSSRPDAVEVEFRVDMGIRGATIGSNYELRMPVSAWQQAPPFTLHQRSVTFLKPVDAAGLRRTGGRRIRPSRNGSRRDAVDNSNQVDLSRLQRLVTRKTITAGNDAPPRPARLSRHR